MKKFIYRILTKIKDEIKDPSGETVEKIVLRLNISSDIKIRAGKFFEITISASDKTEADEKIETIAKNILTNPLVEVYEIQSFKEIL